MSFKKASSTAGAGLTIGGVLWFVTELAIVAAVAAVVASGVTFYLASVLLEQNEDDEDTPDRPTPAELENELASLVATAKTSGLHDNVTEQLTTIANKLRNLIPELHDQYPEAKITWTMNRMVTTYLPDLIEPYADLDEAQREGRREDILSGLSKLDSKTDDVRELVDKQKENEFEKEAQFIEVEFLNEGGD